MNSRKHARLRKIQRARQAVAAERRMQRWIAAKFADRMHDDMLDAMLYGLSVHVMPTDMDICERCGVTSEAIQNGDAPKLCRSTTTGTVANTASGGGVDKGLTLEKLKAIVDEFKDVLPPPAPTLNEFMRQALYFDSREIKTIQWSERLDISRW